MVVRTFVGSSASASAAKTLRFVPNFRELRIHFGVYEPPSVGVLEFIQKFLPEIRNQNPHVPIRLVHSPKTEPWLWARYSYGKDRKIKLAFKNANQVLTAVEIWAMGGHYLNDVRIKATPPCNFTLKDREEKYRNPYAVYSKIGQKNKQNLAE